MPFHRVAAIVLRQSYLLRGSPVRVLPIFAWVAIDIVLWGFITRYLNTIASPGFDFVPMLLGAVLLWDFFTRVMHGVTIAFLEDVWSRNFLNLFASPLSIREYVGGLVLSSIATSVAGAPHDGRPGGHGLRALLLRLRRPARTVPSRALPVRHRARHLRQRAGAPVRARVRVDRLARSRLPLPLRGDLLPGIRRSRGGCSRSPACCRRRTCSRGCARSSRAAPTGEPRCSGAPASAALYILLASWFFTRIHRHAVRTGLLARYSAESVN